MINRIFLSIILLSAISLVFTPPQPLQFVCGLIQAFILPGLIFTFFILNGRISRSDQVFLSILLSPLLLSMLVAGTNSFTGDIDLSIKIILIAFYILFIVAMILSKHKDVKIDERNSVPKQIFICSIIYSGLILVSYLVNNYLLIRSDAWYHAAIVNEIIYRGIPPGEPLVADYSIKYMWFYHLFQALWIKLSGLSLFKAMAFFNIINAFIFPYLIARFTSYFTDKKYIIVLASIFAIAGLDAASWVFWPITLVRVFIGDVTGMAEIKRILANTNINGTGIIKFLRPAGTWQVNWSDKFLTITVFNYSLNLFLACLLLVLKEGFLRTSRVKSGITLFVIILGTFLFHVVSGITLLYTVTGSSILMYIASRYIYRDNPSVKDYSVLFVAAILAASIAVPYFFTLVGGGSSGSGNRLITDRFHFGYTSIFTILLPLIVLFFPTRAAIRKLFSGRDHISKTMIGWIICLLILCVFINIGIVGEKKLIYFLFMIIGPPIYVQIVEKIRAYSGARRILLIFSVFVLFGIPLVLTFRGFMIHTPEEGIESRRYNITDEDNRFFEWVRNNTSSNSVIIENNIYHLAPVHAGRRNFYSWSRLVASLRYTGEKMEQYRNIQDSLYENKKLSPDIIDDIKKVDIKLYVAVWWEDIESSPWLLDRLNSEPEWFKEVYSSKRVSLYELREAGN